LGKVRNMDSIAFCAKLCADPTNKTQNLRLRSSLLDSMERAGHGVLVLHVVICSRLDIHFLFFHLMPLAKLN
jgi:hypothetical protein